MERFACNFPCLSRLFPLVLVNSRSYPTPSLSIPSFVHFSTTSLSSRSAGVPGRTRNRSAQSRMFFTPGVDRTRRERRNNSLGRARNSLGKVSPTTLTSDASRNKVSGSNPSIKARSEAPVSFLGKGSQTRQGKVWRACANWSRFTDFFPF
jgi:hypothetical protein